jgi:hypothetical protein
MKKHVNFSHYCFLFLKYHTTAVLQTLLIVVLFTLHQILCHCLVTLWFLKPEQNVIMCSLLYDRFLVKKLTSSCVPYFNCVVTCNRENNLQLRLRLKQENLFVLYFARAFLHGTASTSIYFQLAVILCVYYFVGTNSLLQYLKKMKRGLESSK